MEAEDRGYLELWSGGWGWLCDMAKSNFSSGQAFSHPIMGGIGGAGRGRVTHSFKTCPMVADKVSVLGRVKKELLRKARKTDRHMGLHVLTARGLWTLQQVDTPLLVYCSVSALN